MRNSLLLWLPSVICLYNRKVILRSSLQGAWCGKYFMAAHRV